MGTAMEVTRSSETDAGPSLWELLEGMDSISGGL